MKFGTVSPLRIRFVDITLVTFGCTTTEINMINIVRVKMMHAGIVVVSVLAFIVKLL